MLDGCREYILESRTVAMVEHPGWRCLHGTHGTDRSDRGLGVLPNVRRCRDAVDSRNHSCRLEMAQAIELEFNDIGNARSGGMGWNRYLVLPLEPE